MALLVGLDVGTTSAKAVVFTDQGEVVGEGRARTPWITTSFGVELAAEELLNAAIEALSSAVDAAPGTTNVTAVGITSMGESGVLVDQKGFPLRRLLRGTIAAIMRRSRRCGATSPQIRSRRQPASHYADSGRSPSIVGCWGTYLQRHMRFAGST